MEADSSLAVLDFFLAHRAVPYVPCTSRHGLFAPRGIARSAAPLVGKAWKAEPYKGGSSLEENPALPDCEEEGVSRAEL